VYYTDNHSFGEMMTVQSLTNRLKAYILDYQVIVIDENMHRHMIKEIQVASESKAIYIVIEKD